MSSSLAGTIVVAPELDADSTRQAPPPIRSRRLDFIDALRGFACLWVCFCHVEGYWLDSARPPFSSGIDAITTRLASIGGAGVDIFIVLSGFCLYWPLIQRRSQPEKLNLRGFYIRRALRLLPVYYVSLALCAILAMQAHPLTVGRTATGSELLYNALLIQTVVPGATPTINGSFWSLALEMQLYLLFPLLVLTAIRYGVYGALIVTFVALSATFFFAPEFPRIDVYALLPARWLQFALGMTAAHLVHSGAPSAKRIISFAAFPLFFSALFISTLHVVPPARIIAWGLAGSATVIALSQLPSTWFQSLFRIGWLTKIGVISYSIYLLQQPFLLLTGPLVKNRAPSLTIGFLIFTFLALPILLALSWLLYVAVERPSMNLGKRWSRLALERSSTS